MGAIFAIKKGAWIISLCRWLSTMSRSLKSFFPAPTVLALELPKGQTEKITTLLPDMRVQALSVEKAFVTW